MKLRPMPVLEVREAWGWIRNGLLDTQARIRARWTPEDVYVEIMAAQAHTFEIEDDGDPLGFAVVKKIADADHSAVLFIWVLWSEPGALAMRGADAIFAELDKLGASVGAKRIRMDSPRKGWKRWEKYLEPVSVVYEREI